MRNTIAWLPIAGLWLAVNGNGERRTFYAVEGAEWWLALWNDRPLI